MYVVLIHSIIHHVLVWSSSRLDAVQAVSMAVDPATIDRVFSNSTSLSTDAVKHFVTQLCAVSSQEVNHSAATFR